MANVKRRAWLSWASVSLLVVLCSALAVLQYRWIGEVSEAERLTLRQDLQTRLIALRHGFDGRITTAAYALVPETAEIEKLGREGAYSAQYGRSKNAHEPLFRRVALAVPQDGGVVLETLDPLLGKFSPMNWPPEWASMHQRLTTIFSGGRMGPFAPDASALFELPRFSPPANGPWRQPGANPARREQEWLLLELNLDYARNTLLPELLSHYLGGSGKLDYDAEVVVNGNPSIVIFRSLSDQNSPIKNSADASVALLDIRPNMPRPGNLRPGPFDLAPPPGDLRQGRWLLKVRHHAGSLEAIVAQTRRRNIAVSGAVLLLILATVLSLGSVSRKAQQLADLQMNFVAGVSHELATPLSVIRTAAFNLRGRLARSPDHVERYGKLIQEESEKLTALVEQVLQYGNAKAGRAIRKRELVPMDTLIENSLQSSLAALQGPKPVIEKRVEPDLPLVLADAVAMKHALQNLVDNALKYGREGSNWIGIFAASVSDDKGSAVEVRVIDRGPGISSQEREHVFDPFFRGRRAVQDQIHGTGLGLNLAKKIIEAHGGTILAKSSPNKGTEFIVRIPAASLEPQNELAHSLG